MAKLKTNENPILVLDRTLGGFFTGDQIERLKEIYDDPGADDTFGVLAIIGACFEDYGAVITSAARKGMLPRIAGGVGRDSREEVDGVLFKYRPPQEQKRVDTDAVRKRFPFDTHPELYKATFISETVSIEF